MRAVARSGRARIEVNVGDTIIYQGTTYRVGGDSNHHDVPLPDWLQTLPLPPRWQELDTSAWTGRPMRERARAYQFRQHLKVLVSAAIYGAVHGRWLHVSVSRADHVLPTWTEMALVKDVFIGGDRLALQVMPPDAEYVNIAEVLHLWHPLDGLVLPDFTAGGQTI